MSVSVKEAAKECRQWLSELDFDDITADEIMHINDAQAIKRANRRYDTGLMGLLCDSGIDADEADEAHILKAVQA